MNLLTYKNFKLKLKQSRANIILITNFCIEKVCLHNKNESIFISNDCRIILSHERNSQYLLYYCPYTNLK
jgi:hypothetical protein